MALIFDVKAIPGSGRSGWVIEKSGLIKVYLKNQPERGKANEELIKLLAKELCIPQQNIAIILGLTNRKKRIKIAHEITEDEVLQKLGLARQKTIFKE